MSGVLLAVDGGNSKTDVVLLERDGTVIGAHRGPTVSHQHVAIDEAARRLRDRDPAVLSLWSMRPQVTYARGLDHVGRYEALEEDFARIGEALGFRAELPHANASGPRTTYAAAMAPETVDILAEVYLQVWRSLPSFDESRGPAAVWLAMIARSRVYVHLRREQRLRELATSEQPGLRIFSAHDPVELAAFTD